MCMNPFITLKIASGETVSAKVIVVEQKKTLTRL